MKLEIFFPALLLLFVVFVVGAGIFYYDYDLNVMRFPYLIGGFLVVMVGWRLVSAIQGKRLPDDEDSGAEEGAGEFLRTFLWLAGILPAVWLLGYLAGIPVYLLVYLRAHGESWLMSVILAAAALAVTWLVFIKFLKVYLPVMPIGLS